MADTPNTSTQFRQLVDDWREMYGIATDIVTLNEYSDVTIEDGTTRPTFYKKFEDRWAELVENTGYDYVGDYAAGIELTDYFQIVRDSSGEFWRPANGVDLPYITTGAGLPEGGSMIPVGDAYLRTQFEDFKVEIENDIKNRMPTAKDYGAYGDGVEDDTSYLLAMGADLGFINLSMGEYRLTSTNIDFPIYFNPGANLVVDSPESVVIRNRINSSAQHIFQGDGEYLINVEAGGETGEDARVVHASWFGVFPSNLAAIDITTNLQRCLNAFSGQTREGIVDTGQGSFHISGPVTVPRGVWLRGAGTRRTIFDVTGDGYTVFTTEDDAVRFTDFQFEYPSGTVTSRDSAFIRMAHSNCEAWDLWLWSSRFGIIVEGAGCSIRNIEATFGMPISSGGALILIRASNCLVDGVRQTSSSTGPDALVDVGSGASSPVTNVVVKNIQSVCPSIPVMIRSTTSNVSGISVDGVSCRITGSTIEAAVKIQTQSGSSVSAVQISNVVGGASLENIVYLNQTSSGSMSEITIDGVVGFQSTGRGLYFRQTAGTLSGIRVGAACSVSHMETPVSISGTLSDIRVAPGVSGEYQGAECYSFTLDHGSAVQLRQTRTIFSGSAILTGASNQTGVIFVRVAPSPNLSVIAGGTNISTHNYALTGNSGTDGTLNIGVDTLNLYVENRTGGTIPVSLSIFSGA